MTSHNESLSTNARNLWTRWRKIAKFYGKLNFFPKEAHPDANFSLNSIDALLRNSLIPVADIFNGEDDDVVPAVNSSFEASKIVECVNKISADLDNLEQFASDNSEDVTKISFQNNNVLIGINGNINARQHFENIFTNARDIFSKFSLLLPFFISKGKYNIGNVIDELTSYLSKIESLTSDASEYQAYITNTKQEIDQDAKQVSEIKDAVSKNADQVDAKIDYINEEADNAEMSKNRIDKVLQDAEQLNDRIYEFQEKFESYDSRIKSEFEKLNRIKDELEDAQQWNQKREDEVERLIEEADRMMAASSNVGLAKSFDDASKEYATDATTAKREFFWSIIFFFVSTMPLMIYLIPGLFSYAESGGELTISGVISRLIILLPAAWLATFTAQRYSRFSDLHKEYRFKAAIAMSIDGFKRQAPEFEQAIAGTAFVNLVEKPEREGKGDRKGENSPNPILNYLISMVQKRFNRLSGDDQSSGS